jgi:hypothetical protein
MLGQGLDVRKLLRIIGRSYLESCRGQQLFGLPCPVGLDRGTGRPEPAEHREGQKSEKTAWIDNAVRIHVRVTPLINIGRALFV